MNKAEINQLAKSLKPYIEAAIQQATDEILTVEGAAKMLGTTPGAIRSRCKKTKCLIKSEASVFISAKTLCCTII